MGGVRYHYTGDLIAMLMGFSHFLFALQTPSVRGGIRLSCVACLGILAGACTPALLNNEPLEDSSPEALVATEPSATPSSTVTLDLAINSQTPADGESGTFTGTVTAVLSGELDAAKVTSSTYLLEDSDSTVGTVSCSGSTATFTMSEYVRSLQSYTATLKAGIRSADGTAELKSDSSWSFTAPEGIWEDPVKFFDGVAVGTFAIGIDANGNAMAVISAGAGGSENIYYVRYTLASGWGSAQLLETDDDAGATLAKMAMNSNGDALAVWTQGDGLGGSNLVGNQAGDFAAIWQQSDGTRRH